MAPPDPSSQLRPQSQYAIIPSNSPTVIAANTISILALDKIEPIVEAERRRGFQGLVKRYMNQLLYGCQRAHCNTATCYTFRRTLSRSTNASRKLTVLSARIIACHLATQEDPYGALCPGKPVVPVMAEPKDPTKSSFREEIHDDSDGEKENKQRDAPVIAPPTATATTSTTSQPGEVEMVTDKGLKDPKSFPQQLFNTLSFKMIEWIGLPPVTPAPKFAPPRVSELTPVAPPPHEPPKFKFHTNPLELIDTGRLHRDAEPVSQHRHQEILGAPKRRASNPPVQKLIDAHGGRPKPAAAGRGRSPMSIGGRQRLLAPPVTPTRTGRGQSAVAAAVAAVTPGSELVTPPQSLARLDFEICDALVGMYRDASGSSEVNNFAKQSLFYVLSTPEALRRSFITSGSSEDLCSPVVLDGVDESLRTLMTVPEWELMILRSMWVGLECVFRRDVPDRTAARLLLLGLHVLAAMLPVSTPEEWSAARKLRGSGRISEAGVTSSIEFENEMAERLMRRIVKGVAYRASYGDGVLTWMGQYLRICAEQDEMKRTEEARGGWSLAVCTLEWCRAVILKAWDGQEAMKRGSVSASALVLLRLLYDDYKNYGLEPEYFYTPVLSDRYDAKEMPVEWFTAAPDPKIVHILDYPFVFPPNALVTYFRAVNLHHMSKAFDKSMACIRLSHQMTVATVLTYDQRQDIFMRRLRVALHMYLLLEVNRATVLEDALDQVFRRELRELHRPLKVRFTNSGEEGVDHGGVQQEFFIIAMREALRPDYGLFTTDDRTRMSWFSVCPVEPIHKYELLGLLVGLAVFNGVTLPLTFPKALYMKLLGQAPSTIEDIADGWGALANGLSELLSWDQGDVGDIFLRTYEFSYEAFGRVHSIDMQHGPEFLEYRIARPPRRKEKDEKKEKPDDTVEGLLDLQNWLPAPQPDERDPWLGGLDEVFNEVVNRVVETETPADGQRERSYEVTFNEWPGEESGWEDVEGESSRAGAEMGAAAGNADVLNDAEAEPTAAEKNEPTEPTPTPPAEAAEAAFPEITVTDTGSTPTTQSEHSKEPTSTSQPEEPKLETPEVPETTDATDATDATEPAEETTPTATWQEPAEEAELVTNKNRKQYVKDYISWLTDRSIRRQYQAFEKGFFTVIDRKALNLFTPFSLQSLVEGIQDIDIDELEKTARYDDGYGPEHKTIRDFWSIVRGFSPVRKRQLLEFVTASDRVPVNGVGSIMFYIQRNGPDTDRVPTSLTCFGRLLLPEYSGKKKLKEKLKLALENGKGFGVP